MCLLRWLAYLGLLLFDVLICLLVLFGLIRNSKGTLIGWVHARHSVSRTRHSSGVNVCFYVITIFHPHLSRECDGKGQSNKQASCVARVHKSKCSFSRSPSTCDVILYYTSDFRPWSVSGSVRAQACFKSLSNKITNPSQTLASPWQCWDSSGWSKFIFEMFTQYTTVISSFNTEDAGEEMRNGSFTVTHFSARVGVCRCPFTYRARVCASVCLRRVGAFVRLCLWEDKRARDGSTFLSVFSLYVHTHVVYTVRE